MRERAAVSRSTTGVCSDLKGRKKAGWKRAPVCPVDALVNYLRNHSFQKSLSPAATLAG